MLVFFRTVNMLTGCAACKLSDLGHLVAPFSYGPAYSTRGFLSTGFVGVPRAEIPISLEEVEREYRLAASQSLPASDFLFVRSWMVFRVSGKAVHPASTQMVRLIHETSHPRWLLVSRGSPRV